jgi:gluconolactonase
MKLGLDGALSIYRERSNAANGLVIDSQDRLIACEGALFERPGVKVQGKRQITRTDLKTGKMEVLADNYMGKPFEGPNDATLDSKGRIYVISPGGALLKFIPIPEDYITNNTFAGPDRKTLYITAGKTLYKIRTDVAGMVR